MTTTEPENLEVLGAARLSFQTKLLPLIEAVLPQSAGVFIFVRVIPAGWQDFQKLATWSDFS